MNHLEAVGGTIWTWKVTLVGTVRVTVGFVPLITCLAIGGFRHIYIFSCLSRVRANSRCQVSLFPISQARIRQRVARAKKKHGVARRRENDVPLFRVHARRPVWVASALQKCKRHCHERFNTFQRAKLASDARVSCHVTNERNVGISSDGVFMAKYLFICQRISVRYSLWIRYVAMYFCISVSANRKENLFVCYFESYLASTETLILSN